MTADEITTILKKAERSKESVTLSYGDKLHVSGEVEHVVTGASGRVYVKAARPQFGTYTIPLAQVRDVSVG